MPLNSYQRKLLALCKVKGANWYVLAREAQRYGGVERLARGEIVESSKEARNTLEAIRNAALELPRLEEEVEGEYEKGVAVGARLTTVVDDDYPATLRLVFNLPPFLFVRGGFQLEDLRSVAVVGTRQATDKGLMRAGRMARLLVEQGVTVVSGLARGIDTAVHRAALEAGGRSIAVIGTGIRQCYPPENRELAEEIAESGALVSQFWPDSPPTTYAFPRRNVTMSGIAQGTVVIEASSTSGAKLQARLAIEHGKRVFLLKSLTEHQPWARSYVNKRGAMLVEDVDDVVRVLAQPDRIKDADNRRGALAQLELQFE